MIRRIATTVLGVGLAALFAWLLARALDWRLVWAALAAARSGWLALALAVFAAGYVVRIARWRALLALSGIDTSFRATAPAFLVGFALNNVLPLRIGDALRTIMVRNAAQVPLADGVGTLLVERFWDLATLGVFFAFGVQVADRHSSALLISAATTVAALGVAALLATALFGAPMARMFDAMAQNLRVVPGLLRFAASFCRSLASTSRPGTMVGLAAYSLIVWSLEAAVLYCCGRAIGIDLSGQAVCFILSTANFSALLPGTPGNIGTFHYFATLAAGAFGVDRDHGAALAILFHAMVWAPITVVGCLLLVARPAQLRLIHVSSQAKNAS